MNENQKRIYDEATVALTELADENRPHFNPLRLLVVGGSSSEMAGGTFHLESEVGKGTIISASFDLKNIDCIPMGEMCDSLLTLVILNPDHPEFVFKATSPTSEAYFDTRMVREAVGGISLNESDISAWMKESIDEEFKPILEV
jgi:hypothetical protein